MADKKKIARITAGVMTGGLSVLAEKAYDKMKKPPAFVPQEEEKPPMLSPEQLLQNSIIENPNIPLKKDEVCILKSNAESVYNKQGVTGYKGGGQGVSLRVAKGVSFHTGGARRVAERGIITEKYAGFLYMTNQRIILLSEKHGFDLKWSSITQIARTGNPKEYIIYHGTKSSIFIINDSNKFEQLYDALCKTNFSIYEDQEDTESSNPFDEIKKYKELLDMGIITDEEFNQKKKELLGL